MAIRRKDRPQYLAVLNEVKGLTYFGYTEKVISAAQKKGKPVTQSQVYRIISGQFKDWALLNEIKEVLAEEI